MFYYAFAPLTLTLSEVTINYLCDISKLGSLNCIFST